MHGLPILAEGRIAECDHLIEVDPADRIAFRVKPSAGLRTLHGVRTWSTSFTEPIARDAWSRQQSGSSLRRITSA